MNYQLVMMRPSSQQLVQAARCAAAVVVADAAAVEAAAVEAAELEVFLFYSPLGH